MPNWPNSIPHYLVGLHPDPGSIENRPRSRPVFLSPQVSNSIRVCEAILSILWAVKPPLAPLFCVCQRPSWSSFLVSQIEKIKFKVGEDNSLSPTEGARARTDPSACHTASVGWTPQCCSCPLLLYRWDQMPAKSSLSREDLFWLDAQGTQPIMVGNGRQCARSCRACGSCGSRSWQAESSDELGPGSSPLTTCRDLHHQLGMPGSVGDSPHSSWITPVRMWRSRQLSSPANDGGRSLA